MSKFKKKEMKESSIPSHFKNKRHEKHIYLYSLVDLYLYPEFFSVTSFLSFSFTDTFKKQKLGVNKI